MPAFGDASKQALASAHPDLQLVFNEVVRHHDCKILVGHRSVEEQLRLYRQGRGAAGPIVTNTDGVQKKSKHNSTPALAVDVIPYPFEAPDWKNVKRFYHMAGWVLGIASQLRVDIRWGGDWDSDQDLDDNKLLDLPHYELGG